MFCRAHVLFWIAYERFEMRGFLVMAVLATTALPIIWQLRRAMAAACAD
jgi:hypothetical protein